MADKMTPRVKEVKSLSDYKIFVAFENGEKSIKFKTIFWIWGF